MDLGRGLIFIVLVILTLGTVFTYYLGVFDVMDLNEQYYEEITFISSNYSGGYIDDVNLVNIRNSLEENNVEGYSYILGKNYSGIIVDRVALAKLQGLNYSVGDFGGRDYVISEFMYKNKYSFYVGDLRDKYNVGKYEELTDVEFENRVVVYDSISEKIFYLHY